MGAIYDGIGTVYSGHRVPDARWAQQIEGAIATAQTIVNVGAGTGSYEPRDREVVAVEPSIVMLEQRPSGAAPAVRAIAESLPFDDATFDLALAVLTAHHWTDHDLGLAELRRVAPRQVIVTWDPGAYADFWLVRDYLPEIHARESHLATLDAIVDALDDPVVTTLLVPADCTDGFGGAYWQRPAAYLEPDVRSSISGIALLDEAVVETAMLRLHDDLASGRWHERNAALALLDAVDLGYRLVASGPS